MSKKKLVSLALAAVLAFTLAVPAMATTVVEGGYKDTPVAVVVPGNSSAYINPYGLPLKVGTDASGGDVKISGEQIVSAPMALRNESEVDLNVHIKISAKKKGGLNLVAAPLKGADGKYTSTNKDAYVYFEIVCDDATDGELKDLKGDANTDKTAIEAAIIAACANPDVWEKATKQYVFSATATDYKDVAVLKKPVTPKKDATTGDIPDVYAVYDVGSIAVFRIAGEVVPEPSKPWAEGADTGGGLSGTEPIPADGFTATIVFTFTPHT